MVAAAAFAALIVDPRWPDPAAIVTLPAPQSQMTSATFLDWNGMVADHRAPGSNKLIPPRRRRRPFAASAYYDRQSSLLATGFDRRMSQTVTAWCRTAQLANADARWTTAAAHRTGASDKTRPGPGGCDIVLRLWRAPGQPILLNGGSSAHVLALAFQDGRRVLDAHWADLFWFALPPEQLDF